MRGAAAHATEVVRRVAESLAEMMLPDAIGDAAPGERIRGMYDPVGQRGPTELFVVSVL